MRRSLLTIVLVLLTGCAASHHDEADATTAPALSPLEISRDPSILYEHTGQWREMSLNGIHLGDDASEIPQKQVRERTGAGWIISRDRCRYRADEGKIITLGVWDPQVLERLNIRTPHDIELRFGRPEKKEEVERFIFYYYAGGHVRVLWNNTETRVSAVNVSD